MPSVRPRLTVVVLALGLERLTVNWAKPPLSSTVGLETLRLGVSLSVPPLPVPSSRMVPRPWASARVALVGALRLTLKVSLPS